MSNTSAFTSGNGDKKTDDYHGGCSYVRIKPDIAAAGVKCLNIDLSFEDALRLATAINSAVLHLNHYKHNTIEGREMGLCISVKTETNAIAILETKVRTAPPLNGPRLQPPAQDA